MREDYSGHVRTIHSVEHEQKCAELGLKWDEKCVAQGCPHLNTCLEFQCVSFRVACKKYQDLEKHYRPVTHLGRDSSLLKEVV